MQKNRSIQTDSGDFHIHFCEKGRFRFYKKGPEKRVHDLAKNYFIDTIKFEGGDVVIDCGANIGELFFYFKNNISDIEYIEFEPSPREFECLKLNIKGNSAYNIGHEESSLDFYISSQGADSSIIQPKSYSHVKKIKASRLDDVYKSKKRIKLLKLEAEGAEPEVLLGCGTLLDNIEYVAADLGFERGIKEESTFLPVANFYWKMISRS